MSRCQILSDQVISESYQELGYDLDAHEGVVGARLHVSFILSSGTSGRRLAAPLGAGADIHRASSNRRS
jgi:hypothetical protein